MGRPRPNDQTATFTTTNGDVTDRGGQILDPKSETRQQQLQQLAERIAGYTAIDRRAWLANKPEQFADIMRRLIAKAQRRQADEWARKVAAFEPHVRGMYCRVLARDEPARARQLLPLIDLYRFAADVTLQPIPTAKTNQPTETGKHHATAI